MNIREIIQIGLGTFIALMGFIVTIGIVIQREDYLNIIEAIILVSSSLWTVGGLIIIFI